MKTNNHLRKGTAKLFCHYGVSVKNYEIVYLRKLQLYFQTSLLLEIYQKITGRPFLNELHILMASFRVLLDLPRRFFLLYLFVHSTYVLYMTKWTCNYYIFIFLNIPFICTLLLICLLLTLSTRVMSIFFSDFNP